MRAILIVTLLLVAQAQVAVQEPQNQTANSTQNPQSEDEEEQELFLHVICHAHMDAGWLNPFEQDFKDLASHIIPSVVDELLKDPSKRFTHAEISYFKMWYQEQNDTRKEQVKMLIHQGRLELIHGGMVGHDEACPLHNDMIDNMMMGRQWLKEEFGYESRIAWHLDQFGHSSVNAMLFSEMGFDAAVFARADYQDMQERKANQDMQFIWQPQFYYPPGDQQDDDSALFCLILHNLYVSPAGIQMQVFWNINWGYSIYSRQLKKLDLLLEKIARFVKEQAKIYKSNHLLVTFGDDFTYYIAKNNYKFIDRVMMTFNSNYTSMHMFYSTVQDYFDAVHTDYLENDIKWSVFHSDFFPYSQREDQYWTGFYTSRPNFKQLLKHLSAQTHFMSTLYSFEITRGTKIANFESRESLYDLLQDILFLSVRLQTHDAITGTSREVVIQRDVEQINEEIRRNLEYGATPIMKNLFSTVFQLQFEEEIAFEKCLFHYEKAFSCPYIDDQNISQSNSSFFIYNPSLHTQKYIHLNLPHEHFKAYEVIEGKLVALPFDSFCHPNNEDINKCDFFIYVDIHGFQLKIINMVQIKNQSMESREIKYEKEEMKLGQSEISLEYLGKEQGKIFFRYQDEKKKVSQNFSFEFRKYDAVEKGKKISGTYVFESFAKDSKVYNLKNHLSLVRGYKGSRISEFVFHFSPGPLVGNANISNHFEDLQEELNITHLKSCLKIRIFDESLSSEIQFELFFARIPNLKTGIEVTANWEMEEFFHNGTFFTDSNGLKTMKRKVDEREYYTLDSGQVSSPNFYPVDSHIMIEDPERNLSVCLSNDKPEAGSAYMNGRMELLINRRFNEDEDLGLVQALNETDGFLQGLNVSANYFLQIDSDQKTILDTARMRRLFNTNPLQIWYSAALQFPHFSFIDSSLNPAETYELYRKELIDFTQQHKILDLILYPTENNRDILVRIELERQGIKIPRMELGRKICKLALYSGQISQDFLKEGESADLVCEFLFSVKALTVEGLPVEENFKRKKRRVWDENMSDKFIFHDEDGIIQSFYLQRGD